MFGGCKQMSDCVCRHVKRYPSADKVSPGSRALTWQERTGTADADAALEVLLLLPFWFGFSLQQGLCRFLQCMQPWAALRLVRGALGFHAQSARLLPGEWS